ncbi:MAG: threonylcarbamoyl-AMP synthase [Azoarcus sp.]|jgi:L-threonylcarbamoyladenylate synthase|nr:threonylcarbamoyl-AMP synthase [Azoarcus sp.]
MNNPDNRRGRIIQATDAAIECAATCLAGGDIVGMPTETVYGLAAAARDSVAVGKIFAVKGRPADHPVIVHLATAEEMTKWAVDIPPAAWKLAQALWPGPLTLILKRAAGVADIVTGGQDTVGLRVPAHPVALALLRRLGDGIAAPSANRFGRISPTMAAHVAEELGEAVALVLDGGPCRIGIESTIVDFSHDIPGILRPGLIGAEEIARIGGIAPRQRGDGDEADLSAPPRVSGSLAAHYAPRTPLCLVAGQALPTEARRLIDAGRRVAVLAHDLADPRDNLRDSRLHWQRVPAAPDAYAHCIYASLRWLDALGVDILLVEAPPPTPAWHAIADRLGRAAAGSGQEKQEEKERSQSPDSCYNAHPSGR